MFPKWERWSLLSTKIKGFSNVGDIIQKSQILLPIPFFNPTPVIIQQIIFFKIFCQFPANLGVRKCVSIDALMPFNALFRLYHIWDIGGILHRN